MPCNCDYMEPGREEINSKMTAQNLVYLYRELGNKVPNKYLEASKNMYGNTAILNDMVVELCSIIRGLSDTQMNEIVYNGRKKGSRQLADWWEEHEAADRKRQAEEYRKRQAEEYRKDRNKQLLESAKAKLSKAEYEALIKEAKKL